MRVATFGDSTANVGRIHGSNTVPITAVVVSGSDQVGIRESAIFALPIHYPMAQLIGNFGIDGQDTFQMLQSPRIAPFTGQPMSIDNLIAAAPNLVILRGGSINDLQGVGSAAEVDTAVGNCLFNHRQILDRMVNGGLKVLDCGIFGYGDDSFPLGSNRNFVRDALLRVNAGLATMANQIGASSVRFVNPLNTLHDSTGKFIAGMTNDGLHPSLAGGLKQAQLEAAAITAWLGAGTGVAYPDPTNLMSNPTMFRSGGAGTIPDGYDAFGFNVTPDNYLVESISGKTFFTMRASLPSGGSNVIVRLPFAQSLGGLAASEVIGCEFDFFFQLISGSAPRLTEFDAHQRFVWGGNDASHFAGYSARATVATTSSLSGRAVFLPFRMPTSGSSLNGSETRLQLNLGFAGPSLVMVGIGNPRLVRVV